MPSIMRSNAKGLCFFSTKIASKSDVEFNIQYEISLCKRSSEIEQYNTKKNIIRNTTPTQYKTSHLTS